MAEAVGILASGIALGQLAEQIARSIRSLHSLWHDIQGGPASLADTLEELEILGDTLLQLHSDVGKQSIGRLGTKSLDYCRKTAEELEDIARKLQAGLNRQSGKMMKQWSKMKVVLGKREMKELQQKLERAKLMLSLAVNCYVLSSNHRLMAIFSSKIRSDEGALGTLHSKFLQPDEEVSRSLCAAAQSIECSTTRTGVYWPFFSFYFYQYTTKRVISHPRHSSSTAKNDCQCEDITTVTEYKILPAYWLKLKAFAFQSMYSRSAWRFSFRSIRVLRYSHPIFEAIYLGQIDIVKNYIKCGLVSLNDTAPTGSTLLHYAASSSHAELCKWLIDQGIDCNAVNISLRTPLHNAGASVSLQNRRGDKLRDTMRVLVEFGHIDPMAISKAGQTTLHNFMGAAEPYQYLIHSQEHFVVDLTHVNDQGQTPLQKLASSNLPVTPILIRAAIRGPFPLRLALEEWPTWPKTAGRMTFLLAAARRLASVFQHTCLSIAEIHFISDLIKAGADIHAADESGATPFDRLLDEWHYAPWPTIEVNKECLIHAWLLCLFRSGVDLQLYFHEEERLHPGGIIVERDWHRRGIYRTFEVYYGRLGDDVTIFVEDVELLPERSEDVPGSWDSELEYADARGMSLVEDCSPIAFWSVTTSGFHYGDYSAERATCSEDLSAEQRRHNRQNRQYK
ncbi:ankyrin [Stipitochalara longipes BDJ]|nr:ankyrin [Stipitochalara longipes BDJ]